LNTTANIPPAISEIIEHLEVPERRVIHGHDMTFHAPVFGKLVSDGGVIRLENSFGWGSAINPFGHIKARRRSFNATLQAPGGVVELASAESCLIIGRHVTLLEAVKCQIFAHTLRIGKANGCMIAGRDIEIHQAMTHKQEPNVITMVVPELPDIDAMLLPLITEIEEMQVRVDELSSRINAFKADSALAHYLSIRSKVRAGMLQLTDDQSKGFLEMADRLDESAKVLESAVSERSLIVKKLAAAKIHTQALRDSQNARVADCRCNIANVEGETIVRQLLEAHDDPDLSLIPLPMIPKILFRNDASLKFLYAVHEGRVEWHAVAECS
jgi:signal transduction histidine kinase